MADVLDPYEANVIAHGSGVASQTIPYYYVPYTTPTEPTPPTPTAVTPVLSPYEQDVIEHGSGMPSSYAPVAPTPQAPQPSELSEYEQYVIEHGSGTMPPTPYLSGEIEIPDEIDATDLPGENEPDVVDEDDPAITDDDTEAMDEDEEDVVGGEDTETDEETEEESTLSVEEAKKIIDDAGGVYKAVMNGVSLETFVKAGYDRKNMADYITALLSNKEQLKAMKELYPFRKDDGFNTIAAIQAGKDKEVKTLFGEEAYNQAKETATALSTIESIPEVINENGSYNLVNAVGKSEEVDAAIVQIFGQKALDAAENAAIIKDRQETALVALEPYKDTEGNYDYEQAIRDGKAVELVQAGFDPAFIVAENTRIQKEEKQAGSFSHMMAGIGRDASYMVPVYGTVRTAQERGITSGWTIASALGDALILTGAAKGAAVGARTYGYPGTAGRVKAAAKGVKQSILSIPQTKDELVRTIKQPITEIIDRTNPGYIPLAGMETSYGTVRIPISVAGSAEDAIKIGDGLMVKIINGEKPILTYKGITYEVPQVAIKGPAHATPSSAFLRTGAKVKEKIGMPTREQGLFISSGVHSRFVPASAFGRSGESPGVAIFGETAKKAGPSGKLYRGTKELESVIRTKEEIPPQVRRGFSRTAGGTRFDVLSESELSRLTKIKARLLEPYYEVKSTFTPAITVKGKRVGAIDLLDEARRYDDAAEEALRSGKNKLASKLRGEAQALREERLASPLDRGAARTLSSEFASYANGLYRDAEGLNANDARVLIDSADRIYNAADYLNIMAEDPRILDDYNSYVSLPVEDKAILIRATPEELDRVGIPPTYSATYTETPYRRETPERPYTPERPNIPSRITTVTPDRPAPPDRPETPLPRRGDIPERPDVPRILDRRIPDRIPREPIRYPLGTEIPPKPALPMLSAEAKKKYGIDDRGTIAHYQGQLNGQEIWYVYKWPYKTKDDVTRYIGVTPPGIEPVTSGDRASYRSIQLITGTPPSNLTVDLGIEDITIQYPKGHKGVGTIRYTRDVKRKTTSRINIKGVKTVRTRPELRGSR